MFFLYESLIFIYIFYKIQISSFLLLIKDFHDSKKHIHNVLLFCSTLVSNNPIRNVSLGHTD